MSIKKVVIVIIVLLSILTIALFWRGNHNENDALILRLYGNIDIREAQLTFNSSEHIAKINVQEGDAVKKGQLLAHLHTELLEAQLAEAEAALLAQKQVVNKLEAGNRKEDILKAQAELDAARARAKAAVDSYKRKSKLLKKRLSSPDDVENARSLADAADAQMAAAIQTLALLKAGPRQEDIAQARALFMAREAGVALARQRLEDTNLYAPADGVIRNRILEVGDMASPQTPVLTLAFVNPVWVRAYAPETKLGKLAPGMSVDVTTDSFPDKVYKGWIGFISPTAEFTPKNVETPELRTRLVYQVRVYTCNAQNELRLGMPATVTIPLNQATPESGYTTPDCSKQGSH